MIHELGAFVFDTLNRDLLIPVDNFMDACNAIFPCFLLVVWFLQMTLLDTVLDISNIDEVNLLIFSSAKLLYRVSHET